MDDDGENISIVTRIDNYLHFWKYNRIKDVWIRDNMNVIQRDLRLKSYCICYGKIILNNCLDLFTVAFWTIRFMYGCIWPVCFMADSCQLTHDAVSWY